MIVSRESKCNGRGLLDIRDGDPISFKLRPISTRGIKSGRESTSPISHL